MFITWEEAAKFCETFYGTYANWEEGYFICPECNEPIYACDWSQFEICPICEFDFVEEA